MIKFKPTYLYIKQHLITHKLYFGKTIRNPEKYNGSGKHWKAHLNKHGKELVVTLWSELFTDKELLVEFALMFSEQLNIVISTQWLNEKIENGLDGGTEIGHLKGIKKSIEHRKKMSDASKGKSKPYMLGENNISKRLEVRQKQSIAALGKIRTPFSEEWKLKMSISRIKAEKKLCIHCNRHFDSGNYNQWHGDKCKLNK